MSDYYDWAGQPITSEQWAELFQADRQVGLTKFESGVVVSTIYLGLNHGIGADLQIFETMVMDLIEDGWDLDLDHRYATYEEANDGHKEVVQQVQIMELRRGRSGSYIDYCGEQEQETFGSEENPEKK